MSTQATIRSIPPVHNGIGQVYREELPPNVSRVELKYCEQCGKPFVRQFAPTQVKEERVYYSEYFFKLAKPVLVARRVESGERYCAKCKYAPAPELRAEKLLKDQENYKAQLPGTPNQMRHSMHLVRHDESLKPKKPYLHKGKSMAEIREVTRAWHNAVIGEFAKKGKLNAEELQALIPGCWRLFDAVNRCRMGGINIKRVAWFRREGVRGCGMGVYALPGVSPEAVN
jgi:hypothetical protein